MSSLETRFIKRKIILKYCLFYETIIILEIVYNMIIFIFHLLGTCINKIKVKDLREEFMEEWKPLKKRPYSAYSDTRD